MWALGALAGAVVFQPAVSQLGGVAAPLGVGSQGAFPLDTAPPPLLGGISPPPFAAGMAAGSGAAGILGAGPLGSGGLAPLSGAPGSSFGESAVSGSATLGMSAGESGSLAARPGDPPTLHRAFHYGDIAAYLLERPSDRSVSDCRELCTANESCAAWEVCAPLGDGCDGCYLIRRAPRRFAERPGWHAEVLVGREDLGWDQAMSTVNMTFEACHEFLLNANGADQSQPFHEPATMQRYTACGFVLRDEERPRQVFVSGQQWPTFLVTNFWDPPVTLPREVEQEMFASGGRRPRPQAAIGEQSQVTAQLHAQIGTTPWDEHMHEKPRGPHAFLLPFYDTNIGHWMKQHGSMNPLQSYEMQSLLQEGDVAIDVGANLGCYTVPFAERVGPRGKVLAFEPFRWLNQIVSGNVAINGLGNVWVLPVGLGTEFARIELRPPQLQFFSSPGGMKLQNQQNDLKPEESMQLYNWDSQPERVTVVSLDDVLINQSPYVALLGAPPVSDVRLIKIDVEGMEKEVIAGARQTVQHFKPIIWTENVAYFSSNGKDISFLQLMDELEYQCAQAQNAPNDVICTDRQGRGHQINT